MKIRSTSKAVHLLHFTFIILYSTFSSSAQISQLADNILLKDSAISKGHIGISIFDPVSGTYLYEHNAEKYFMPASNVKLFTLYAGMKYLGDSIISATIVNEAGFSSMLMFNGDPTFLHKDFSFQPVYSFLKNTNTRLTICGGNFKTTALGKGWAWDDYNDFYMTERSNMPIYGNVIHFTFRNEKLQYDPLSIGIQLEYSIEYLLNRKKPPYNPDAFIKENLNIPFQIKRDWGQNLFRIIRGKSYPEELYIPFKTDLEVDYQPYNFRLILDTVNNQFVNETINTYCSVFDRSFHNYSSFKRTNIYSQPSDSLFTPMMHKSDNFFAEQTLLMVSNQVSGFMSDEAIIDSLTKSALKDIPQKPRWVDGSGLSRYNLFTPNGFIYILNKLKNEFGIERLKNILPAGGEGTLENYFLADSSYIFAKTGTMSNNTALSGYLITKKNKLLIFSIIANNYQTGATPVRRAFEKFLKEVRNTT